MTPSTCAWSPTIVSSPRSLPAYTTAPAHTVARAPIRSGGRSALALRASRAANGVSRRHGEVARGMWNDLWPDRATDDVPIGHVTNGVHVPTWLGAPMRELLDRHLGDGWMDHQADPATWAGVSLEGSGPRPGGSSRSGSCRGPGFGFRNRRERRRAREPPSDRRSRP